MNYTTIWKKYFYLANSGFSELVSSLAFQKKDREIYNKGAFLFVTGYAKPFRFKSLALFRHKTDGN